MKMTAGSCLRASSNRRRMRAAPRPANISTNEEADCEKNCAPDSCATALASSVLPVPGGPCSSTPWGTFAPSLLNGLGSRRNSTTSISSAFASSTPAMSSQPTSRLACGLICTGFVRGISFRLFQSTKISASMKTIPTNPVQFVPNSCRRSVRPGGGGAGWSCAWRSAVSSWSKATSS